ncbi:MAG: hypothetical protein ACNA76_07975, partial [Anaerosomatales bacterium]
VFSDGDGNSPADVWNAVAVESEDRIPPRGHVEEAWDAAMPEKGPLTISATLYYRSCTEEIAEEAGVDIPTTTMASVTKAVYTSQEEAAAAQRVAPDPGANTMLLIMLIAGLMAIVAIVGFFAIRSRRA